jgi:hypothetical protein
MDGYLNAPEEALFAGRHQLPLLFYTQVLFGSSGSSRKSAKKKCFVWLFFSYSEFLTPLSISNVLKRNLNSVMP